MPDSQSEWLWEGFLGRGLITSLSGRPKEGKTTLLCYLFKLFHKGGEFRSTVKQCNTLILTEEPLQTWRKRYQNGLPAERLFVIKPKQKPAQKEFVNLLEEVARFAQRNEIDIVVIDTLAKLSFVDEEKAVNTDWHKCFADLNNHLLSKCNVALLVCCHDNKKRDARHVDRILGGTALAASVDIILSLSKPKDISDCQREIECTGREIECCKFAYEMMKDGTLTTENILSQNELKTESLLEILDYEKYKTVKEITAALGKPRGTILGWLEAAEEKKLIEWRKEGRAKTYRRAISTEEITKIVCQKTEFCAPEPQLPALQAPSDKSSTMITKTTVDETKEPEIGAVFDIVPNLEGEFTAFSFQD